MIAVEELCYVAKPSTVGKLPSARGELKTYTTLFAYTLK